MSDPSHSETPDGPHPRDLAAVRKAFRSLDEWVRSQLQEAMLPSTRIPETLAIHLEVSLHPGAASSRLEEDRFLNAVTERVAAAAAQLRPAPLGFEPGHVYCHWCRAARCEHSQPAETRAVFTGYDPTGKPQWKDLATWLLAHQDVRVERLFEEVPQPIALYTPGIELVRDLLADFGKRNTPYHMIGQVACGYFPLPAAQGGFDRGIAVTMQLIETRPVSGDVEYHLNLIAAPPPPHVFSMLIEEQVVPVLTRLVKGLREEIWELQHDLLDARRGGTRPPPRKLRTRAARILERLPMQLEKLLRQRGRRTRHAEVRNQDPSRPTGNAVADAIGARVENFYVDRKEGTVIVRGPKNRIHVFRKDGAHVTSVVYPGKTIRARIRARRWAPLDPPEIDSLRARFAGEIT